MSRPVVDQDRFNVEFGWWVIEKAEDCMDAAAKILAERTANRVQLDEIAGDLTQRARRASELCAVAARLTRRGL